MNRTPCQADADQLIQFADGELSAEEEAAIREHLETCESCRRTVDQLNVSLAFAEQIWEENAHEPSVPSQPYPSRTGLAVAVALMLISGIGFWVWSQSSSQTTQPVAAGDEAEINQAPEAPDEPDEISDVNELLAAEFRAARLAASAELLAATPALQEYSKEADAYLVAQYSETSGSKNACQRNDTQTQETEQ